MNNSQLIVHENGQMASSTKPKDSNAILQLAGNTLRLWWLSAAFIGVVAAVGAAAVIYSNFQPEYKASMWLRIYSKAPYIAYPNAEGSGQFVENQTQLIRSRLVLGPLLSDPAVAELEELSNSADKIGALSNRLVVSPVGRSEYFAVEFHGIAEETSKLVVQRVVESYMTLLNSDEARQRRDVLNLLESEKEIREQKVVDLRESLAKMVEDSSADESPENAQTVEQLVNLSALQKEIVNLDVEAAILNIEIQAFENAHAKETFSPADQQIHNSVDDHPQVRDAESEIDRLENELLANNRIGSRHPNYKRIFDELESRKSKLRSLRAKLQEQQVDKSKFNWQSDREQQLEAMQSRLASVNIKREVIDAHVASDMSAIRQSSGDSLQVEFLRAELAKAMKVKDLISDRLLALNTEERAPARVEPLESGGLTVIPIELVPFKKMAMASAGAFAIPFILLFGLELLWRRVSSSSQLEDAGQLHVIGEIANLPRARLMRHLRRRRWAMEKQLYRESVDHLRTSILCQESGRNAQVIAVTSAVSGEGKTSLALQLTASLAAATGRRVLLIDGDLRYPNAHTWFETELSPGLSDVLEKSSRWETVIRKSKDNGPYLLTAGELLASPHRLFGGNEFRHLIKQLRRHFRYIVIDTPPVLSASESLVMAKSADAVLFCAMRDRSRIEYVHSAHERLTLAGAQSIGTVLTGVPFKSYTSKYGVYAYPEQPRSVIPNVGFKRRSTRV